MNWTEFDSCLFFWCSGTQLAGTVGPSFSWWSGCWTSMKKRWTASRGRWSLQMLLSARSGTRFIPFIFPSPPVSVLAFPAGECCKQCLLYVSAVDDHPWKEEKAIINQINMGTSSKVTGWSAYGLFRAHRYHLERNGTELWAGWSLPLLCPPKSGTHLIYVYFLFFFHFSCEQFCILAVGSLCSRWPCVIDRVLKFKNKWACVSEARPLSHDGKERQNWEVD